MKISNKRLGLLGGGQLGMYFCIAAKNMGYQITLLDPNKSCPASKYSDIHIATDFDDVEGVNKLISNSERNKDLAFWKNTVQRLKNVAE